MAQQRARERIVQQRAATKIQAVVRSYLTRKVRCFAYPTFELQLSVLLSRTTR